VTALNSINNQLDRADYDVLMIYDQEEAAAGILAGRGVAWAPAVQTFTALGGVVVVLTGGGGISEMHELIAGLGIFSPTGTLNHNGQNYRVDAPGDAVGVNVVSPFVGVETSCVFTGAGTPSSDVVYVTSGVSGGPGNGEPGVVHRIIVP
jgi:hypothetical protein